MKKMLSVWLVAVLLVGFGSTVFAANVGGVNSNAMATTIFSPVVQNNLKEGDTVNIALGMSSFVSAQTGQPLAITDVTNDELNRLVRITTNNNNVFESLFSYRLEVYPAERNPNAYVRLCITAKAVENDRDFGFTIGLVNSTVNAANVFEATPQVNWGSFSGTVKAVQSSIIGFNYATTPSTTATTIKQGGSFDFMIPDSVFNFSTGTGKTFTSAMVNTYGFTLFSNNSYMTPVFFTDAAGKVWVRITVNNNAPVGQHTAAIYLRGSQNGMQGMITLLHEAAIYVESSASQSSSSQSSSSQSSSSQSSSSQSSTVISATGNKITGIDSNARLGYTNDGIFGRMGLNGSQIDSTENLSIRGDDEITLEFDSDTFLWEKGKPNPAAWVTSSMIRTGKITVKVVNSQSKNLVDTVDIRYTSGRAYVRVKFVEHFVSTKEKDFSITLALAYNGSVNRDTSIVIEGTMENDYIYVYDGDDYVDLSYGEVAYAEESIRSIDVDLGEGVTIHARMSKGKKYYGTADTDPSDRDYNLMNKYPEIDVIYNLSTVGLNNTSNTVSLDVSSRYHVYNSRLEYLGTTDKKLPYSTKYYLTTKQLDFSEETDDDIVDDSGGTLEEETSSGSGSYPTQVPNGATPGAVLPDNENYNPTNGR